MARRRAMDIVATDRILGYIRSVRSARDVVSITRLKNEAAELVRQVSEEGRTLIVTQNGAARVVVMDVVEFDRMQDALALLKMIAQGEADIAAGETVSIDAAFDAAARRIGG
jgi:prevent-host-death family protein